MIKIRTRAVALILVPLAATACGDGDTVSAERFCELSDIESASVDPYDAATTAEAEELLLAERDLLADAAKAAPEDIRPAAEGLADNFELILDIWEAAAFDDAQLDEAAIQAQYEAQFGDFDAVAAWTAANCS